MEEVRALKVKMLLPALTEATGPYWRPIKYSLFPPLGLATLAGYLDPDDQVLLQDEHTETLDLDDEPDLVVIQAYITSAYRAYALADHYRRRGAYVVKLLLTTGGCRGERPDVNGDRSFSDPAAGRAATEAARRP